jgi:transposase
MINTYLVIVDNCPIHRFNGEVRVSKFFLQQMGVGYIFLPRYSPELNIAENCFLKVKTVLKQE